MLAKKKKKPIRKNRYKTPESKQKKKIRFKVALPFTAIFSVLATVTGILVCCGIFVLSYSWLTQTSWFNAQKIEISGMKRLTELDVLKQADIKYGMNIFDMNLSVIRQRLLAHPWVKKAELIRVMPDKLELRLTEHVPYAVIEFDKKYIMNKDGVIFKDYTENMKHLPVVSGLVPDDLNVYADPDVKVTSDQLKSVMDILKIKDTAFKKISDKKADRIIVDREIGLSLLSEGQIKQVRIGYGDYPAKLEKLEEVVRYITKNDNLMVIETINLINLNRIVIKPAEETKNYSHMGPGGNHAIT